MPLVIVIPLLLWFGMVAVPFVFEFVAVEISWLAQAWILYASLGFIALLSALMRQWVWWYWLALSASIFLTITHILGDGLEASSALYLAHVLPLLLAPGAWLLSSRPKPPLWTPAGVLLLVILALLPYGLSLLPWSSWLALPGLGLLTDTPLLGSVAASWFSLAVLSAVIVAWWLWRLKRTSQPRHWAEFAVGILLIGAILSSQQPLLLQTAFVAVAITVLLGLSMQMLNLAYVDELTQLPGRRALFNDMRKLGRRSAVTMLDVDHFKKFNDTYGHDVGDQVLKLIAAQLQKEPGCKAYRYGGEEFTLLFSHDDKAHIHHHLESVRERIAGYPLQIRSRQRPKRSVKGQRQRGRNPGKRVTVTVSLGCAIRQSGETSAAMIKRADTLLYKAKKAGRNCAVIS